MEIEIVPLTVRIPAAIRKALRVYASQHDTTVQQLVREAIALRLRRAA